MKKSRCSGGLRPPVSCFQLHRRSESAATACACDFFTPSAPRPYRHHPLGETGWGVGATPVRPTSLAGGYQRINVSASPLPCSRLPQYARGVRKGNINCLLTPAHESRKAVPLGHVNCSLQGFEGRRAADHGGGRGIRSLVRCHGGCSLQDVLLDFTFPPLDAAETDEHRIGDVHG